MSKLPKATKFTKASITFPGKKPREAFLAYVAVFSSGEHQYIIGAPTLAELQGAWENYILNAPLDESGVRHLAMILMPPSVSSNK